MKYFFLGDLGLRVRSIGLDRAVGVLKSAGLTDSEVEAVFVAGRIHSQTSGPFSRGFLVPLVIGSTVNFAPVVSDYFIERPVLNSVVMAATILLAVISKYIDRRSMYVSVAHILAVSAYVILFDVRSGVDGSRKTTSLKAVAQNFRACLSRTQMLRSAAMAIAQEVDFLCHRSRDPSRYKVNGYARIIYAYGDLPFSQACRDETVRACREMIQNVLSGPASLAAQSFSTESAELPLRKPVRRQVIELLTFPIIIVVVTAFFQAVSRLVV